MLYTVFCVPFKYRYLFNCDSRKISNFEKWLGLSRGLAHPVIYVHMDSEFRVQGVRKLKKKISLDSNLHLRYTNIYIHVLIYIEICILAHENNRIHFYVP